MQIKHKHILVPGRRYQDSRHLLQNPKVSKSVMGFNNHAQRSTPPYYLDVDNPFDHLPTKVSKSLYHLKVSESAIIFAHIFGSLAPTDLFFSFKKTQNLEAFYSSPF